MISNIFSCFSEQASAILLVFVTISIIWNKIEKRKISKYLKLHLLIISIFSAVSLLAPGNMARSHAEMLAWYQSFEMLSFFDKIVQVVINVSDHLINSTTLLFSMITILSSFLIITNKKIK